MSDGSPVGLRTFDCLLRCQRQPWVDVELQRALSASGQVNQRRPGAWVANLAVTSRDRPVRLR